MTELLLLGGGTLVAYLLFRHGSSDATASAPPVPPQPPVAPAPTASPPPPKLPQIASPTPLGEVAPNKSYLVQLTGRWGWPVPRWQGRAPVISDGYGSPRPGMTHKGVDLMFGRISSDAFPTTGPNGSKLFVMPDIWPAVAASDGVLWSAGPTLRGYAVVIDHGTVATFYQHLSALIVPETKPPTPDTPRDKLITIKAGQPLGIIGGDPSNPPHLKHLHFELWPRGPESATDPRPYMKTWQIFTPNDVAPLLASARNAAPKRGAKRAPQRGDLVPVRAHERRWPGTSLTWLP
jgi:murein DD-endopeptidase MepM/ murein hydrolase activator NlpD